jgi:hypothetical protein
MKRSDKKGEELVNFCEGSETDHCHFLPCGSTFGQDLGQKQESTFGLR